MIQNRCDLIIDADWIVPVSAGQDPIENASIAISQGLIVKVGGQEHVHREFQCNDIISLEQHILLPGLVNAHGHAAMSLFRGYAEDSPLEAWLTDNIWPLENKWVNSDFVKTGTRLALAEMIHSGITCFADMYFFPEIVAKTAKEFGMRSQIAFPILPFPTAWSRSAEECFHKGLDLHDEYRADSEIKIALGPHAAYSLPEEDLRKVFMFSEELNADVHMHLLETATEVADGKSRMGYSWIAFLDEIGLLGPRLQAVHVVHAQPTEIDLLSEKQVRIIHCPTSNLKLASGIADINSLISAGLTVGLGTDSAASNNSLDILAEARMSSLLSKHVSNNAAVISATKALEMATLGWAKALGLDHVTGSLETGKSADIIAVDMRAAKYQPIYDPIAQLIYTNSGAAVTDSWVQGKRLLENRNLVTMEEEQILKATEEWRRRIAS